MSVVKAAKPLGRKAYGSIGHLPGSKLGPGDHRIHDGQARILTEKCRKGDTIIVQEKLDGSCCSVAKVNGEIVALSRAGYLATTSPYPMHHLFAEWVAEREGRFRELLVEGERVVGEWLAQAHGTEYDLDHEPFVVFDIMVGTERATHDEFISRIAGTSFVHPATLYYSDYAVPVASALKALGPFGCHGAKTQPEGVVYRCERGGRVEFLAKHVRSDFDTGRFLEDVSGQPAVWNWRPEVLS